MKNARATDHQSRFGLFLLALTLIQSMFLTSSAQGPVGRLAGRVVGEDGQPIPNASVFIIAVGGRRLMAGQGNSTTDEDGNFQIDGLDPAPYLVGVNSPGYVVSPSSRGGDYFSGFGDRQSYVFTGESVVITMVKGGVITGRVTDASGAPVVRINVLASCVKDEDGRPSSMQTPRYSGSRLTDDRGIYRIYGLPPGSYIVSTSGIGQGPIGRSPFSGKMSIYYPSATRETAQEVVVRAGDEVAGVDIRYRSERGFSISGKVTGAPQAGQTGMVSDATIVVLRQAGTGAMITSAYIQPYASQNGYAIYGLPNGEYEATATRESFNEEAIPMASPSRRITINGRDVAGVDLALAPLATIIGNAVLEKNAGGPGAAADGPKCESKREPQLREALFSVKSDEASELSASPASLLSRQLISAPDEKGAFRLRGLKAGRYRLQAALPDENWYLKSILQSGGSAPADLAKTGLSLKSGETLTGVTATIANGAAGLKGKVLPAAGAKPPGQLRVFLVPTEAAAKDDLLRYAEVKAEGDGSFSLSHLAPGKYLLTTRPVPATEPFDKTPRPVAWDNLERLKLRKEAEAANNAVELKSCQRVVDHQIRIVK